MKFLKYRLNIAGTLILLAVLMLPVRFSFAGSTPNCAVEGIDTNSIPDGTIDTSLALGTDFGNVATGQSKTNTFTIVNSSASKDLTVSSVPITGTDSTDFNVVSFPGTVIKGGGTGPLIVSFTPGALGARGLATITINNDSVAPTDVYTFMLGGTGVNASAEMDVWANGNTVDYNNFTPTPANLTDFGSGLTNSYTVTNTFVITNTGSADLTVNAPSLSGPGAGDFSITSSPSSPVSSGSFTTFKIAFTPTSVGLVTAKVSIVNNDSNENPYEFGIQGTGVAGAPEMDLWANGNTVDYNDFIPDPGNLTDFGSGITNSYTVTNTFVITNTGTANLTNSAPAFSGPGAGDFSLISSPSSPVSPGSSTTFKIAFTPTSVGLVTAKVSIVNNDSDENPYEFGIQGTGETAPEPEMDVWANGNTVDYNDFTPAASNLTDFGNGLTNSYTVTNTFVITNTGTANLTNSAPTFSGPGAGDFSLVSSPSSPVSSGSSTTFKIAFTPTSVGLVTAKVSIVNNDSNENPYEFGIQGTGIAGAPEMDIWANGNTVDYNDFTPTLANLTDFGGGLTNSYTVTNTFVITNTGTANLTNSAPTFSGPGAGDFSLVSSPSSPVSSGSFTTFKIAFTPTSVGIVTAKVSIVNNDSDENPYEFGIQGNGTSGAQPEMDIWANGNTVDYNDFIPAPANLTDFGSGVTNSYTVTNTFVITNTGTANLTNNAPTFSGPGAGDFSLVSSPSSPVLSGSSTTFKIAFTPTSIGLVTAKVSIVNNDSDENPYEFGIQGTGETAPEPEMDVWANGNTVDHNDFIPDPGNLTDFGSGLTNSYTVTNTFVITNTGTANLTNNAPTFSGPGAGDFSLISSPSSPVSSGSSTTFKIAFTPTSIGLVTAKVSIVNNDSDENPYEFGIQGTGQSAPEPEMDIWANGNTVDHNDFIPDPGNLTDFGSGITNTYTVTNTFVITNTGSVNLTNSAPTFSGPGAGDFSLISSPSSPVSPGSSTTFKIAFTPTSIGLVTAKVSIVNNDSDENPYEFGIQGTGAATYPEMAVFEPTSGLIADEGVENDAWKDRLVGELLDVVFTITNTGSGSLNLSGSPKVDIYSGHTTDFTVQVQPGASIAPGNSDTFTVRFTPQAMGPREALLRIVNDDQDENPYNFTLQASGVIGHNAKNNAECVACHGSHQFGGFKPDSTEQDSRCRSCHSPGGDAATMTNVANHIVVVEGVTNEIGCGICHITHNAESATSNRFVSVDERNGDNIATNIYYLRSDMSIISNYVTGAVGFTNLTYQSTNQFAFTNAFGGVYNGVCQSCHSRTKYHTWDGSSNMTHYATKPCWDCHNHKSGFKKPSGGSGCLACHGEGTGSLRAIASEFSTAGGHGHVGGNDDCEVCHMEAYDFDNYHPSGEVSPNIIDLRDPDSTNVVSITAPFSRNTNSATLEAWVTNVQDVICFGCHDSDGATYTYSTNGAGNAFQPFASTNAYATNVYDQFNPNNYSHHAIRGPGTNEFCTSTTANGNITTMVTPWNQSGNHNVISCFDCHIDNGHGHSTNQKMLWSAIDWKTIESTTAMGSLPAEGTKINNFCGRCHLLSTYFASKPELNGSRFPEHPGGQGQHDTAFGCMGCHAGPANLTVVDNPVGLDNDGRASAIHGNSTTWDAESFASGEGTYIFVYGGYMDGLKLTAALQCGGGQCAHPNGGKTLSSRGP